MADAQQHAAADVQDEMSDVSLEEDLPPPNITLGDRPAPHHTQGDAAKPIKSEIPTSAPDLSSRRSSKTEAPSDPEAKSRRPSLSLPPPGISVSPAVAGCPPISPAAQALKQRQEAVDASTAPSTPTTTATQGPAIIPAFPASTSETDPSAATIHPPNETDSLGYPAPGSAMAAGQAFPVIAIQEPLGEEDGVLKFGKPVAPGGSLAPDASSEGNPQEPEDNDLHSLSGNFDKVDLSDDTGYQKGMAMLEQGQTPTPDMMSPQEWLAFQQQRSSGLGKKHPTAQPGGGKDQQEGGWLTPYAREVGRTFGRLASSVENQITAAYKRGEQRRDRVLAMVESAQQAAAQAAAITPEVFEAFWRKLFNAPPEEELEIAYACSLNTEAGPVPGVVYQSNRSLAFNSDKPVAYPTVDGHSEQAAYKLMVPWAEVASLEGIRSQPLVQEQYVKVTMANGDELWFLRFHDYNRGLTGMQSGLKDFKGGVTPPAEANVSKPNSKPPSRSATPPPKHTRSNSRGRQEPAGEEGDLQETYTVKVHEAIERARISSSENLPGISPSESGAASSATRSQGKAESTASRGDKENGESREDVPVEKPGGGDILDAGQKEEVTLPDVAFERSELKAPGAGDILDVGVKEEVSLPAVESHRDGKEEAVSGSDRQNHTEVEAAENGEREADKEER